MAALSRGRDVRRAGGGRSTGKPMRVNIDTEEDFAEFVATRGTFGPFGRSGRDGFSPFRWWRGAARWPS